MVSAWWLAVIAIGCAFCGLFVGALLAAGSEEARYKRDSEEFEERIKERQKQNTT